MEGCEDDDSWTSYDPSCYEDFSNDEHETIISSNHLAFLNRTTNDSIYDKIHPVSIKENTYSNQKCKNESPKHTPMFQDFSSNNEFTQLKTSDSHLLQFDTSMNNLFNTQPLDAHDPFLNTKLSIEPTQNKTKESEKISPHDVNSINSHDENNSYLNDQVEDCRSYEAPASVLPITEDDIISFLNDPILALEEDREDKQSVVTENLSQLKLNTENLDPHPNEFSISHQASDLPVLNCTSSDNSNLPPIWSACSTQPIHSPYGSETTQFPTTCITGNSTSNSNTYPKMYSFSSFDEKTQMKLRFIDKKLEWIKNNATNNSVSTYIDTIYNGLLTLQNGRLSEIHEKENAIDYNIQASSQNDSSNHISMQENTILDQVEILKVLFVSSFGEAHIITKRY